MFIIVPKHRKRSTTSASNGASPGLATTAVPQGTTEPSQRDAIDKTAISTQATADSTAAGKKITDPYEIDVGPVRSTTACDACRVRKTKCNGQEPCARCRTRQIICVYSRPAANRNLPASASQVALLQHQQRRLYAAVQNMASIIARQNGEPDRAPESFNVLQLLQKYAPEHAVNEATEEYPTEATAEKRGAADALLSCPPAKRIHKQGDVPPGGMDTEPGLQPFSTTGQRLTNPNPAFDLLPAPDARNATAEQWSDSYQALMQFLESMNARNGINGSVPEPSTQPIDSGQAAAPDANGHTQRFLDLVDWDASMQLFQDSYDPTLPNDFTFPP